MTNNENSNKISAAAILLFILLMRCIFSRDICAQTRIVPVDRLDISHGIFTSNPYKAVRLQSNNLSYFLHYDGRIADTNTSNDAVVWSNVSGWLSSLVFVSGFNIGGKKPAGTDTAYSVSHAEFVSEYQPGRILNSGPLDSLAWEDPAGLSGNIYVLPEHGSIWPAEAPHNELGNPLRLSARDTWAVFNDMGPNNPQPPVFCNPCSRKLGVEVQRQSFQFLEPPFQNAILFRYVLINKSDLTYDSAFFAVFEDPDVQLLSSNLTGIDTSLLCIYTYNNPADSLPLTLSATGILVLQSPLEAGSPSDTAEFVTIAPRGFDYRRISGNKNTGSTGAIAHQKTSGEPENLREDITRFYYAHGKGPWGETKPNGIFDLMWGHVPYDQRFYIGFGPFTFLPGDTQEIWYALIGADGTTRLNAVDTLLNVARLIKNNFQSDLNAVTVGTRENPVSTVGHFTLHANYPNPFNPSTVIRYQLAVNSKITLKVYNLLGQEVRTLVNTRQSAGMHSVVWDGKNNHGQRVSSGVYLYRLETGEFAKTRKMILIK